MIQQAQFQSGKCSINKSARMMHKLIFTLSELAKRMDELPLSQLIDVISAEA